MSVTRVATLDEALARIAAGARPIAGGTAFRLDAAAGKPVPADLVAIGALLPKGIAGSRIGAGTDLELLRWGNVPLLSAAAADVAAPNIRRLATLGGTIGWRAGCLLPALLALDAQVGTTHGPRPLADWLARPEGLVLSVTIAPLAHQIWRKTGLRAGFCPAIIAAAGSFSLEGDRIAAVRLAVGGGAVAPARLPETEGWLLGQPLATLDREVLRERIEAEIAAPDCAFRSARYRRRVAANALVAGLVGLAPLPRPARPRPAPAPQPDLTELSRAAGGERWHMREDMPAKVRGTLAYMTDVRAEGMLVGCILRAAHPHAKILAIDTAAAEALPGVRAVVTHRDVPGMNAFGILFQDQPALCSDRVRYLGDAVAAVAAVDAETAERALALIRVDYRPLPLVEDMEAALAPGAQPVHAAGNLLTEVGLSRGDLAAGFAAAVHVVEDTYVTPRQMHGFMETEGGWAAPEGEGVIVCAGGQHGARDRMQLARILALPEDKIRVVTSPTGGAFGGKDELTVQPALALLALKARAPVRLHLSRAESVLAGTKRNPFRIRMRTGCDAEGRLVAQEVEAIADSGAYASLSPGVLETAMEHAAGPYRVANIRTRGRLAYTNNGTGGAFRGFGANQMSYAIECQIDRLAARCGLDPVEIRRRNLRRAGAPGFLGQKVAPTEKLSEMLDIAAASDLWAPAAARPDEVTGTGIALNYQGNGLGTIPTDEARFEVRLEGGKIRVFTGLDEIGQGMVASVHAAVAERLHCARADIEVIFGDTGTAPDSGSTTASRGGYVVWRGTEETAPVLAEKILAQASLRLGLPADRLRIVPGGVQAEGGNHSPTLAFSELAPERAETFFAFPKSDYRAGNARFIFAYGVTLARVAISRVSGAVRVLDLEIHTAAGKVIDMASYLGQMEGGLVQGLGFTLTEDMPMTGGRPLARNFDSYLMPTVRDVPERMRATAHEPLDPADPFGPRGVGELGIGAVTPAIANAVADALGAWPATAPFPPETLLAMLEAPR